MTIVATPAFAQLFDPNNGTGNVLAFSYESTAPQNHKTAARQSGLHSFALVPERGPSRVPQFDYDTLLWGERQIRSVANMTRGDARDFLALAPVDDSEAGKLMPGPIGVAIEPGDQIT